MIKKITILFLLILLLPNTVFAKSPPPGTGSLVPANILIMLDNSGSMAWDLDGTQLTTTSRLLTYPVDVQVDSVGDVYVLTNNDRKMTVFDSSGVKQREFLGYGSSCNKLNFGRFFDIYNDEIYLLDRSERKIKVLSTTGQCLRQRQLNYISGLSYSGIAVSENYIFVATDGYAGWRNSNSRIIKIYDRKTLNLVSTKTNSNWYYVQGIDVNADGDKLVVTSIGYNKVCVHTISGTTIGSCTQVGTSGRGTGTGYFNNPIDAVFDSSGNVYVTDQYNNRVQKFTSSYVYSAYYAGPGANNAAPFYLPYGMGISSDDEIYIADTYNHMVRELSNTLSLTSSIGLPVTRMSIAHNVIKRIVSNSELTSSANFGLMEWGHPYVRHSGYPHDLPDSWKYHYYGTRIRVPVSHDGARKIITDIDNVRAGGGTYLKRALDLARSYFTGSQSPIIANATCQLNYLIVISDGQWANHSNVKSAAANLNNQYKIQTFAVGFVVASSLQQNYEDLAVAGGTTEALYADNEAEMIIQLTDAIKQVVSGSLTFNTPAVMSNKQRGEFIYQSTFKYSENTQWEGHIKKHKFDSKSGTLGAVEWDAADELNNKEYTDRNLWTIGLGTTNLNNFTISNSDAIENLLFPSTSPTDTEVENLINFIRGIDTYDEDDDNNTTESRHKLSDIYHANINVVGPVEGSTENDGSSNFEKKDAYYRSQNNYDIFKNGNSCGGSCSNRTEVVLAGSNGGILHAFNALNGEELWGYIPPNIIGKLSTIVTSKANATNPIYAIDGSAVVKDVYYDDTDNNINDPSWKTILLSGLGAGGHGYFALDITDINSPEHLFAIENDPFNKVVRYWGANEVKSEWGYQSGLAMPAEYDYQKLGEAWSTPRIIRIKHNGKDKWVAVFGGGFNSKTNPNYGSAVFVMDIEEDGTLLKKIDIADTSSSDIVNSIPADLTVITANGTEKANYSGAIVYAADLEGKITKINLTDQGTMYDTTTLFNSESTNSNGRYIYNVAEATINDNVLWLYFGTGDKQKLQTQSSNILNRLYGIKDKDFPDFKTKSSTGTVSQCKTGPNNCPGSTDLGWYVNLDKSKKVTAAPTIDKNKVWFPVYEPKTTAKICESGDAILGDVDSKCGDANFKKLGTGVLSKVVVQGDKLVIGISGEADKNITSKENLITIKSTAKGGTSKINLEGWKEN